MIKIESNETSNQKRVAVGHLGHYYPTWQNFSFICVKFPYTLRRNSSPTVYHHLSQLSVDIQLSGLIQPVELLRLQPSELIASESAILTTRLEFYL